MQLSLDSFFGKLPSKFNRGHMRKPWILSIMVQNHLLFEFFLSFVLIFMHNKFDFKGIDRQKVVVLVHYVDNLVLFEVWEEIHYEFFVVLQNDYPELLKDMPQIHLLFLRNVNHHMERIHFFDLRVKLIFDYLDKYIHDTVFIDLLQITMVHTFLFLF